MKPRANTPPAAQRLEAVLLELVRGKMPGEKLPTVRALAEQYQVGPVTVHKALLQLQQAGWIVSRPGLGSFVTQRLEPKPEDFSWQEVVLGGRQVLGEAKALMVRSSAGLLPLSEAILDESLYPFPALSAALRKVSRDPEVWHWASAEGLVEMRTWVADELEGAVEPRDVQIVSGGQAGLSTVFRALALPGAPILMESPTYPGALAAARAAGLQPIPVPTDAEGIRPEYLSAAFARYAAKVVYMQPLHANPTGATLALERREAVIKAARSAGAFIIENDYARGLTFDGAALSPLIGLDPGRVIYIRSFSKTVAPGMRVAAIVARGPAGVRIRSMRVLDDHFVSPVMQRVLLELLQSPSRKRHLKKVGNELRKRRDFALEQLRHLPQLQPTLIPRGGGFLWLSLSPPLDDAEVSQQALQAGVQIFPGRIFFPAEAVGAFLRLSYSAAPIPVLQEGLKRLGKVLDKFSS